MNQYVNKRFSNQYKATIGADLFVFVLSCYFLFYTTYLIFIMSQFDERGYG